MDCDTGAAEEVYAVQPQRDVGLPRPVQHLCAPKHRDGLQADGTGPCVVLHQPHLHNDNVYVRFWRTGGHLDRRRASGCLLPERHPYVELLQRLLRTEQQRAGGQCRHIWQGLLSATDHPAGRNDVVARDLRYSAAAAHRCLCLLRHNRCPALPTLGTDDVPGLLDSAGAYGYVVGYDNIVNDSQIPRPEYACGLRYESTDVRHAYHLPDEYRGQQELRLGAEAQPAERHLRVVALLYHGHRTDGLDGAALLHRLPCGDDVHWPAALLQS